MSTKDASKLSVFFWNTLSIGLAKNKSEIGTKISTEKNPKNKKRLIAKDEKCIDVYVSEQIDFSESFPLYQFRFQQEEEQRSGKLAALLQNFTTVPQTMKDIICLTQVHSSFIAGNFTLTTPTDIQIVPENTDWKSATKHTFYYFKEPTAASDLGYVGEQGMLFAIGENWDFKEKFINESLTNIVHIGHLQVLLKFEHQPDKRELWIGGFQSYPLSWPLLFDSVSSSSSSKKEQYISRYKGNLEINAYLIGHPKFQKLSKKVSGNLFSPFNADAFVSILIPKQYFYSVDEEIFQQELPNFNHTGCKTEPYSQGKERYRILFAKTVLPSTKILDLKDLAVYIGTNSPEVMIHSKKPLNKPEEYIYGTFFIIDSIYIAEEESLEFQYFLKNTILPLTTPPTTAPPEPKILVFASYAYSPLKTRVNDFLMGKTAPWFERIKEEAKGKYEDIRDFLEYDPSENAIRFKCLLKENSIPTWWIPCSSTKCKYDPKTPNVTCVQEYSSQYLSGHKCVINQETYPIGEKKFFGIISDQILYSVPSINKKINDEKRKDIYLDKLAVAEHDTYSNFRELYHRLTLHFSNEQHWAHEKNIDLSKYFSDHLAFEAMFEYREKP